MEVFWKFLEVFGSISDLWSQFLINCSFRCYCNMSHNIFYKKCPISSSQMACAIRANGSKNAQFARIAQANHNQ